MTLSKSRLAEDTIEEHRSIVAAIAARNAVEAHDEMVMHLINNRRYILRCLKEAKEGRKEQDLSYQSGIFPYN